MTITRRSTHTYAEGTDLTHPEVAELVGISPDELQRTLSLAREARSERAIPGQTVILIYNLQWLKLRRRATASKHSQRTHHCLLSPDGFSIHYLHCWGFAPIYVASKIPLPTVKLLDTIPIGSWCSFTLELAASYNARVEAAAKEAELLQKAGGLKETKEIKLFETCFDNKYRQGHYDWSVIRKELRKADPHNVIWKEDRDSEVEEVIQMCERGRVPLIEAEGDELEV